MTTEGKEETISLEDEFEEALEEDGRCHTLARCPAGGGPVVVVSLLGCHGGGAGG
jgi:hypothetical protein